MIWLLAVHERRTMDVFTNFNVVCAHAQHESMEIRTCGAVAALMGAVK